MKTKLMTALVASALCSVTAVSAAIHSSQGRSGDYVPYSFDKAKNHDVKSSSGEALGKLTDAVVDLESGRLLYAQVSTAQGQNYTIPGTLFTGSSGGTITANTDKSHLTSAPQAPNDTSFRNKEFVSKVYQHYGQQPWWNQFGTATGRDTGTFGNVQQASHLVGMQVQDTSGQSVGTIHDVVIDFKNGRAPFVQLTAPNITKANHALPIPSMALTQGSDQNHLTTGVDRNKLQSAPQVQLGTGQLNDPKLATKIYQFYGKQPYWTS